MDLLGVSDTDLQSDIVVGKNAITGVLKNVTGYTGFSSKPDEQSGHYLALYCHVPADETATVKVLVVGGSGNEVTLDSDRVIILRIKDTTQKVRVTAKKAGYDDVVKTFSLTGLVLED